MATEIHYPNELSTIDALWTIFSSQTETVKKALAARLKDSLSQNENTVRTRSLDKREIYPKMKSIFLDTNILVDLVCNREPFVQEAK